MPSIDIVLDLTGAGTDDDPTAPPSSSDLFTTWGWTPGVGTVSVLMLEDRGDQTGVFRVTGPQSLMDAIEGNG